jgi:GT2 family glycosyltransferase
VRHHGPEQSSTALDVVICTYSNGRQLEEVLAALAEQDEDAGRWRVLVVDNNSTDDTPAVVDRWAATGSIPGLRRVVERIQGLTPARQRGVAETDGPWIAFVDDDCVLDRAWVRHAAAFAAAHPDAAGFGGRVRPVYERQPPELADRGWLFAEQDLGDEVAPVDCLVGAGMVVSREALATAQWIDRAWFADRIGRRLVSGGDVEMALRLGATGTLWYVPDCELEHRIAAGRTELGYLTRLARGLGVSAALAGALTWRRGRRRWLAAAGREAIDALAQVARGTRRARRQQAGNRAADLALTASYELGRLVGLVRVAVRLVTGRCPYFGGAAPIATSPGGTCASAS